MEGSALSTGLSFDFVHVILGNVVDRRVDERPCLLHPPISPVDIASTSSQKTGEEAGRIGAAWSQIAGCRVLRGRERPGSTTGTLAQGFPRLSPPRDGGAADAAANNQVHTSYRYIVDCCWEFRRVPLVGKVGEVRSPVSTEVRPHCTVA